MPEALPLLEIAVLLVALLAIALAQQLNNILKAVADLIPSVHGVFDPLKSAIMSMAQGISYVLGKAEAGVDAAIGASWHLLAHYMDKLWQQIEREAIGYLRLSELVAKLVYHYSGLRSLVHYSTATLHGIEHGVKTLERKFHGIEARLKRLEHDVAKGIGNDVRTGLRDLRTEVKGIEGTVTTTIPNAIDYAEAQTTALGRFIGAIPGVSYLDWVKGLALAGLAALGLDWIKCEEGKSLYKQRGCGMWNDLGNVFGWLVDLFIVTEVCDVLPLLDTAVSEIATPFVVALTDAGAGLCAPGSSAPPALDGPAIDPPAVYFTGTLTLA